MQNIGILRVLAPWGRDKMAAVSQTTFSNENSWMKMCEFRLRFQWILFVNVQFTTFKHWFSWWLGADQATSHYLNQCYHSSSTHICVTRPQWVTSSQYGCRTGCFCSKEQRLQPPGLGFCVRFIFLLPGSHECNWNYGFVVRNPSTLN